MARVRVTDRAALAVVAIFSATTQPPIPAWQETPLFTISKSENKNQVQYALSVDNHCAPASAAPVHAYWRMLELGPTRTAPLLGRELPAYGISSQKVLETGNAGGKVWLTLRAMPTRPILVETVPTGGACQAWSTLTIDGSPAHLYNVHVKLRWPFGIDYILLQGWSIDGKRTVSEKVEG